MQNAERRVQNGPSEQEKNRLRHGSQTARVSGIAVVAACAFLAGHYGRGLVWPVERSRRATATGAVVLALGDKGRDAPDIPAPPRAERQGVISSGAASSNMSLRYHSADSPADVAAFYSAAMPARGWEEQGGLLSEAASAGGVTLSYSNSVGIYCIIAITESDDGGTGVTVLRAPLRVPRPQAGQSANEEARK